MLKTKLTDFLNAKKLNEDLFKADNKIKSYEKEIINALINFLKNKWNFDAKIIVKKYQSNKNLIGNINLSNSSINDNKFILYFNSNLSYIEILKALIHELTHIKQVTKGELKASDDWKYIIWKDDFKLSTREHNKIMKNYYEYIKIPWENEAFKNENDKKLLQEFFKSTYWSKLKEIDDINLKFIINNII